MIQDIYSYRNMRERNFTITSDSYKQNHHAMYPPGIKNLYSYLEPREGAVYNDIVWCGLQFILKEYMFIGTCINREMIQEGERICKEHFGYDYYNSEGWQYIRKLGYLPLNIYALPEGTIVKPGTPCLAVENTDERVPWLTNFVESILLHVYYMSNVATRSYNIYKILNKYCKITGDKVLPFHLNDFGLRGATSLMSAEAGGIGHLMIFNGTDNIPAMIKAMDYYNIDYVPGISVKAAEHSTIMAWGKSNELEAYNYIIDNTNDTATISIVIDSYNWEHALTKYFCNALKEKIQSRTGKVVVRPDCYDEETEILTEKGWKYFKDLNNGEQVAQYNSETREISFVTPNKWINENYTGDMIHIYSEKLSYDLLVTPNHRMYVRRYHNDNNGSFKSMIRMASDVKYQWQNRGVVAGNININKEKRLSWIERLLIAFQADGTCRERALNPTVKRVSHYTLEFNISKKRKLDRLCWICDNGDIEYKVTIPPSRGGQYTIYVKCPIKPSKFFDDWIDITSINWRWGQEFIEEVSYWDASRIHDLRLAYGTTEYRNAELVQLISILSGYRCSYSIRDDKRKDYYKRYYLLQILMNDEVGGQSIQKDIVHYNGKIYCVTVPSGLLVVRRNKCVSISGNSGNHEEVVPKILNELWNAYGGTYNKNNYKLLDNHIGIIVGDGVTESNIDKINKIITDMKFSPLNILYGSGGHIIQQHNRDTNRWAFKLSSVINSEGTQIDVFKTSKDKQSKPGRFNLPLVYSNGKLIAEENFTTIRNRIRALT